MIGRETVNGYDIRTDYYPLDHQWETNVAKSPLDFDHTDVMYDTYEAAVAGHALIVRAYKGEQISADDMPGDVRVFMGIDMDSLVSSDRKEMKLC